MNGQRCRVLPGPTYPSLPQHYASSLPSAQPMRGLHAGGLPKFVIDEFEAYLRCGILEHGLAHLACSRCGHSIVVALSCKRRGFWPSCLGRCMSDVAAHLVEEVLPKVPVRRWVCSLPWRLRYAMGYDRRLCADVLAVFIAALRRSLRHRAKLELGLGSLKLGLSEVGPNEIRTSKVHSIQVDAAEINTAPEILAPHRSPPEPLRSRRRRQRAELGR
jgi:hypothetical protein